MLFFFLFDCRFVLSNTFVLPTDESNLRMLIVCVYHNDTRIGVNNVSRFYKTLIDTSTYSLRMFSGIVVLVGTLDLL